MDRLKNETWELHQQAEHHPFQQALVRGELPLDAYGRHLGQLRLVYGALEEALRNLRAGHPELSGLIEDRRFHEDKLADDAEHIGAEPNPPALPATQRLIDEIGRTASERPLALLGFFYVLEGSTNGGRFIAKALRRAYEFPGPEGTRAFDPYADGQREAWLEFKDAMGRLSLTPEDEDAIVARAKAMFQGIGAISAEMHSAPTG